MIEAVFYRHFSVWRIETDTVAEAVSFLNYGEDDGSLSSVGVFVDGEPYLIDQFVTDGGRGPTPDEAAKMREAYAEAKD